MRGDTLASFWRKFAFCRVRLSPLRRRSFQDCKSVLSDRGSNTYPRGVNGFTNVQSFAQLQSRASLGSNTVLMHPLAIAETATKPFERPSIQAIRGTPEEAPNGWQSTSELLKYLSQPESLPERSQEPETLHHKRERVSVKATIAPPT